MSNDNLDIQKLSMFYPKTKKGLIVDYPELSNYEVFKSLSKYELLFVWYFACKSSPFIREEDPKIRAERSILESFGQNAKADIRSRYMSSNFPEKIRVAVAEMQKFEIGPRIRAKMMVEKIMTNYSELVDIDVKTEFKDKDQEEDWTKKKAYIDSCAKISSALPTLIVQSEGTFGITQKDDGETVEIEASSIIDAFHDAEE